LLLTRSHSASALKSLASGRYAFVSRSLLLLNRSLLTRVYLDLPDTFLVEFSGIRRLVEVQVPT
jgi:hypothetical protein